MPDVMIDSGAHSFANKFLISDRSASYADTKEFKEYLERYITFLHQYKDRIDIYVTLDVIGNAEKTWEVQKYIESCGLNPLPVFHHGEDFKWLKKYLDNYDYIGIGGLAARLTKYSFKLWGDKVFGILTDDKGKPLVKVHGFAMTSVELVKRYPWASIDSTSWLMYARHAQIATPYGIVIVSSRKDEKGHSIHKNSPQYIDNQPPEIKRKIEEYLESKGYTLEGVSNIYNHRDEINVLFFKDLETNHIVTPFKGKRRRMF